MADQMQSVAAALDGVARWKKRAVERRNSELAQVDNEIGGLEQSIANLQAQLTKLQEYRKGLESQKERLPNEVAGRSYTAIFEVLTDQAKRVSERATTVSAAQAEREKKLDATLAQSDTKELIDAFNQFKSTIEPTLASLPAAYRTAIEGAHTDVEAKLQAKLEGLDGPIEVDSVGLPIDIVWSVDAIPDEPALVLVVVPIADNVVTGWADRAEDLQTWLGARVVQALQQTLSGTAGDGAPLAFGGHQGLLALEFELPPEAAGSVRDRLGAALADVMTSAPELAGAKVTVTSTSVEIDHILPPEGDDGEEGSDELPSEHTQEVPVA